MIPSKWAGTGLLSLLGVKTGGRLPAWPDPPQIVPTVELLAMIAADPNVTEYSLQQVSMAGGSLANLNFNLLQVPPGQVWGIMGASSLSAAIAAGAARVLFTWNANPAANPDMVLMDSGLVTPSPGNGAIAVGYEPHNGFLWLPPGTVFTGKVQTNTVVAATNVNLGIRFVRCSI